MTEAYVYDAIRTPRGKGKKTAACSKSSLSTCWPAC